MYITCIPESPGNSPPSIGSPVRNLRTRVVSAASAVAGGHGATRRNGGDSPRPTGPGDGA